MTVSKPTIEIIGTNIRLKWETEKIQITVSRIYEHKNGIVNGEILIENISATKSHLHQAQFNFSSSATRKGLAKQLSERYPDYEWIDLLEQLCVYVLRTLRQEEPVVELHSDMDDTPPPKYMLYPIMPLNAPTTIYGDGGSGKSYIALTCAICLSLSWKDNSLGLRPQENPVNTLYLDWETDENTLRWRLKKLTKGLGLKLSFISYRRCSKRFVDDIDEIRKAIQSCSAHLIIIDSIGAAVAGDMNSAEVATQFFTALRTLNTTSLLINHQSKNDMGERTSYGSVYFRNYSRSEWQIKKTQETDEDTIEIALFQKKANDDKLHKPLGYRIHFNETIVKMERCEINENPVFFNSLSLANRIKESLKHGKKTTKELADELNENENSIKSRLNEKKNIFYHFEDGWGLLQ